MVTGFEGGEGIMKINKKELLLTSLVCLLPLLAGVALYPRLPETMATHWGFDGTANGWSSRAATVFGLPLFILALHLICFYAESHGTNRNMNPVLRTVMLWICPAMSLLGSALTLGTGLGYEMHISTVVPVFSTPEYTRMKDRRPTKGSVAILNARPQNGSSTLA